LKEIFSRQNARSIQLRSAPVRERMARLQAIEKWLMTNRSRIGNAVHADMHKPFLEVDTSEVYPVLTEVRHTLANLDKWVQPVKVDATLSYLGTRSEIRYEPKGTCLIISPWNFPFNLCIGPLVSCLAAGNTAILKPSELTPFTSGLVKEMMAEIFD